MLRTIEYWKNTLARLGVRVERRRVRRSLTGVRAGIETLERRQVMSIDSPLIAGFSVSPEIVPYGSQVTLAATGVTDPGGAAIAQVRFHIDADNDGQLTPADGAPLAVDTDESNGWSAVVSSLLSQGGNQRYFALAQNGSGIDGEAVSATNTVLLPAKIIDNSSSSGYATVSSQYWSTSSVGYSGGHQFEFGATGGYAEWTFANLPAGEYRVFATWAEGTNRGTNVPYSVSDGSLNLATVKVNQRVMPTADVVASSKNFQNLGAFSVVNGSIVVRMTNSSGDGRAIADAVRIQHIGPAQQTFEIRVFDGGTELTDAASVVNLGTTFYGTPSAAKTLTVKNVGLSDLVLTPLTQPNMPAGVTLVSSYASTTLARGASTTFQVRLSATNPGAVSGNLSVASNDPDEGSFDIAISGVVNGVKIIDNTSATGYSTVSSGYWSTSSAGYSGGHQFEFGGTGGYAEWNFANLPAGEYRVSATWAEGTNRGTNVPYTIFDGSYSLGAVPVNQRIAPAADVLVSGTKFQNLRSFSAINSSLIVRITNSSGDGRAIADAVRIEYLGPAQQAPEIRVFDGGVEIHDNASAVNLGSTFYGTPSATKTLTVTNSGTTGLILSPLTQANMPAGITLVSSYGSSTLAPGASTSFQVRLSAMSTGVVGGVLSLSSNDPSESSFHITLTGVVEAAKIIDNGDVGYSTVSSNYWSTTAGYQFEFGATGGYAEWSFPNLPAGEYRISAAWPNDPAWSSIAPFSILDGGVALDTVRVNQQLAPDSDVVAGGKKFQDLGLVGITNGSLVVRLTHEGPNRVVADAIRVQYVGKLPEVQFDDTGAQFEVDGATATVLDFGQSERSQKAVEVIAVTNQTSSTLSLTQVTQADLPAGYLLLSGFGASTLASGESAYARIRLDAIAPGAYDGAISIQSGAQSFSLAITGEVIKAPVLVDNGDPGFSTIGSGWQNGTAGDGFQDDYLKTSGAASGKAATWTVEGLAAGAYLVYAAYLPSADNTAAAQYNLYDGTLTGGLLEQQGTINQRLAPSDVVVSGKGFGYVGQINVSSSTLTVELDASNLAGGFALADAIYVLPAALGTFFGLSSPGNMVTGSAESIETRFVDPDAELADSIGIYRDSDNNGLLDIGVDQLLHSDATPGDGLNFDASTLASGTYRLFVAAVHDGAAVASTTADVTAAEWWKVAITQPRTHGEVEFSTTGDLTADETPIKLTPGLTWIDAVYSRVYGQVTTYNSWESQYYYYTFPYRPNIGVPNEIDGAFDVDIQSALEVEHPGHNSAKPGDTQLIVLEDLTRAARNDYDYDDQYWVVEVTSAELVDLDIDSDNTGPIERSHDEEDIEDNRGFGGKVAAVGSPRVPMIVEFSPGTSGTLALAEGTTKVVLWTSQVGGEVVVSDNSRTKAMGALPGFPDPTSWTFWVEAIEPSDTIADVAFTLTPDNVPANSPLIETVLVTTVVVDLDTDSNNDGAIDPVNDLPAGTDDPIEEQAPGRIVFINADDDNQNGVADALDPGTVVGENDLAEIVMNAVPYDFPVLGTLVVTYDDAFTRLYADADRRRPLASGAFVEFGARIYAEGREIGTSLITVTLSVNAVSFTDTVRITVIPYPTTLDVDIDSDNNQEFDQPAQSTWEDTLEVHPYAIGKLIMLDNPQRTVTPIVLEMPTDLPENLPSLGIRIDWDAAGVAGWIRLWNTPIIDELRNPDHVNEGGNGIYPGFVYNLSDLNYNAEAGRIVIYAEGYQENAVLKTLAGVESFPKVDERVRGTLVVNGDDAAFDEVKYIVANEGSFYYQLHTRQEVRNELASRGVYTFADMPKFSLQPKSPADLLALRIPTDVILNIGDGSAVAGFKSMLYQDYVTGERQYVVSFAGTDDTFGQMLDQLLTGAEGDWQNNISQGLGAGAPPQYVAAMEIGDALSNNDAIPQGHLIATGHSLGGGLASAAAVVGGIPADTFNAAWLRAETLQEPDGMGGLRERYAGSLARFAGAAGSIDAYYVDWDILTFFQSRFRNLGFDMAPVGTQYELDGPEDASLILAIAGIDGLISGEGLVDLLPGWLETLVIMGRLHENRSVLYGLLVTEGTVGTIQIDMLGYSTYF